MRERFVAVAGALLDERPDLAVLTADLSSEMFAPARRRHPDRVVNVGIREQLLVGVAGGMSLAGMRPIAHSFAPFLVERPFEQIKLDLNHQGVGAILVSAGASYDIASGGRTHQAPADVALLNTLPDWTVHVPGHADEVERQLRRAAAGRDLVYLRLSNQSNRQAYDDDGAPGFRTLRRGTRGTVVAVGPLCDTVLAATEGLDVTVLYAATLRPFDAAAVRHAVAGQREVAVAVVEPLLEGTSAGELTRALADVPSRILSVGVAREELRAYGTATQHAIAHGLDAAGVRRRLGAFLAPAG
ncbi:transketolase family protein [Micromonospora sp. CPCC 205561]|uniref:transketolase family protein n=1 Tax=Micromonospora sp. CPCC 205561 TaxID=3122407 RepID=UPI002FF29F88